MNRDFKGVWIPKEVWLDKNLTLLEKFFLVEIDSLDNKDGCFATNDYFSEFFDISKSRSTQIISSLNRKKYITVTVNRKGNNISKRIIKVFNKLNRYSKKLNTVLQKTKHPYLENCEYNNTIDNNTINKERIKVDLEKLDILNQWLNYRIEINQPIKILSTINTLVKKINSKSVKEVKWVIENSIENNWRGLFWEQYKKDVYLQPKHGHITL